MKKTLPLERLSKLANSVTVLVDNDKKQATGITFRKGKKWFVLTCAHFLYDDDYRVPIFSSIKVKSVEFVDGKRRCPKSSLADVVVLSKKLDFVILRLRKSIAKKSAVLGVSEALPDTEVFCFDLPFIGSKAPEFISSKTDEPDKRFPKLIHVRIFLNGGCSGGGLFLSNGVCIGIADRGYEKDVVLSKNSGFFRGLKSICEWAKRNEVFEKYFPEVVGMRNRRMGK